MKTFRQLILTILLFPVTGWSQMGEYLKTMDSLRMKLSENKYSCSMQINFYESAASPVPLQSEKIEVDVFGDYMHYSGGDVEVFKSPGYIVNIDHAQRTILVNSNLEKKRKASVTSPDKILFDSLLQGSFDASLVSNASGVSHYRIIPKRKYHQVSTAEFKFNTATLTPKRIDVYYQVTMEELFNLNKPGKEKLNVNLKSKPHLVIEYTTFTYQNSFQANTYSFSDYVTVSGKSLKAGTKAATYKLIDFTQTKGGKK